MRATCEPSFPVVPIPTFLYIIHAGYFISLFCASLWTSVPNSFLNQVNGCASSGLFHSECEFR